MARTSQKQRTAFAGWLLVAFVVVGVKVPTTADAQAAHCQRTWSGYSQERVTEFRSNMEEMGVYDPESDTYKTEALGNALLSFVVKHCTEQLMQLDDGSDTWLAQYAIKLLTDNLGVAPHEQMPRQAFEDRLGGPGFDLGLTSQASRSRDTTPASQDVAEASTPPTNASRLSQNEGLPIGELQLEQ